MADYMTTVFKALDSLNSIIKVIFTSVFVHRVKDTCADIRGHSLQHLGTWILNDPAGLCQDEYLKYLGWTCSDHESVVRLQSVLVLDLLLEQVNLVGLSDIVNSLIFPGNMQIQINDEKVISTFGLFLSRFIDRFIVMAVGDIEETISYNMLAVLRKLQQ
jgi:hypothetical protein